MAEIEDLHVPYGEVTGYSPCGVPAYSNFSDMHFSGERAFDGKIFTGFKWQCVEYARRWLLEKKGLFIPDIPWAVHIFFLTEMELVATGEPVPVAPIRNGTKAKPEADSLLIYPSEDGAIVGHVAAITEAEVGEDGGYIRICDQNLRFHKWDHNYSAELKVVKDDEGNYHIQDRDPENPSAVVEPLGWVTFPDVPNRNQKEPLVFHEKYHDPVYPLPSLRLVEAPKGAGEASGKWLDTDNSPAERLYEAKWGASLPAEEGGLNTYYAMNMEQGIKFVAVGNQLHKVFLHATKNALQSPELLQKCGIPQQFWGRLRRSFVNQRKCITGRFDFGVNGEQMKLFEYNAESSDLLFECGTIQQKWAESVGIAEDTRNSGGRVTDLLDNAWKQTQLAGKIHFIVAKDDLAGQYTAEYLAASAKRVGFFTKICLGFDEFSWKEGHVVDGDGKVVRHVWKAYSWAAAFEDHAAAAKERGPNWEPENPAGAAVRLSDIVLGEESINVFEPLWKAVMGSKALLPVVYGLNSQHPALLETSFTLTESLKSNGYVKKPVGCAGGAGITIVDNSGAVVEEAPAAEEQPPATVYQQFLELPSHSVRGGAPRYAIASAWMIGDHLGGSGVCESTSRISTAASPFKPLRTVINFNQRAITKDNADDVERGHPSEAKK